jgi:UDP-2-acetamido-2-deoxy-ribo-hexuluronate aminotransferase
MIKSDFKIEMVDLKNQYLKIKSEIDKSILNAVAEADYINGNEVDIFTKKISTFLNVPFTITCGNGTDALQIALMSLNLNQGDEVIVPAFTYAATAEVICLLGLIPVLIDVDIDTFNVSIDDLSKVTTKKTKVIIPVHLFGQCSNMDEIINFAKINDLFVIEDSAQSLGSEYYFKDSTIKKAGTIGDIGCTSFFPSKNLGCFGDGGAIFTSNQELAEKIKMISNHGQFKKYIHKYIGVNSRLDNIQAAILNIKINYLDEYTSKRINVAKNYKENLAYINEIKLPYEDKKSKHVFNQYTIKMQGDKREKFRNFLLNNTIPTMVYYPLPLHKQEAFSNLSIVRTKLTNSENLSTNVVSIPIHTELTENQQEFIIDKIKSFFK